jgi:hypothetical protein
MFMNCLPFPTRMSSEKLSGRSREDGLARMRAAASAIHGNLSGSPLVAQRRLYSALLELWKDGDSDLVLLETARGRLKKLSQGAGVSK